MNKNKECLGIRMAKAEANLNSMSNDKEKKFIGYKQSLVNISDLLDEKDFVELIQCNKDMSLILKDIIIKSVKLLS